MQGAVNTHAPTGVGATSTFGFLARGELLSVPNGVWRATPIPALAEPVLGCTKRVHVVLAAMLLEPVSVFPTQ